LRILLEQITVTLFEVPRRALRLRLLWHAQAVTEVEVIGPGSRGRQRTVVRLADRRHHRSDNSLR
jgi:hypothetical protein